MWSEPTEEENEANVIARYEEEDASEDMTLEELKADAEDEAGWEKEQLDKLIENVENKLAEIEGEQAYMAEVGAEYLEDATRKEGLEFEKLAEDLKFKEGRASEDVAVLKKKRKKLEISARLNAIKSKYGDY